MLEKDIVNAILRYLKAVPACFAWKTHGGMYGTAGIPDIIACIGGRFVAGGASSLDVHNPADGSRLSRVPLGDAAVVDAAVAAARAAHAGWATTPIKERVQVFYRYKTLLERDPELEARPTFLFFKGAANGLFAEGAEALTRPGVDEAEALRIGIRCERNSHRFFKRYGEKFEDSEGKQIFLEFAEEERDHLELLIREYRALITRTHAGRRKAGAAKRPVARGRGKRLPA